MPILKRPLVLSERQGKWLMNLFPPFFFQRICLLEFGAGFRSCRLLVRRSLWTRNLHGSTFGGAIFSAADPILAIMYWQIFARKGQQVETWLKSASIQYRMPAETALTLEFRLPDREVDEARAALERHGRFARAYRTEAVDRSGAVCAEIETEVYVRRPAAGDGGTTEF